VNNLQKYQEHIASLVGCYPEQLTFYWKGRVALYAALKAIGIKSGDEVILPAFTCVVVPNAIIYLGATPVYVDIERQSLNANKKNIEEAITDKTKCIIIQNTFGLSTDVQEIVDLAKNKSILTIEDCTHGFGGKHEGKMNGSYCDFAFYSTQWNKPFSTGIGGILLTNNLEYSNKIQAFNEALIKPGLKSRSMLSILLFFNKYLITDKSYWLLLRSYRFLSRTGLVIGSSSDEELKSIKMPENYLMASSSVQFRAGNKALNKLDLILKIRKENARAYTKWLSNNSKYYVSLDLFENHSFLKYPILVKDRAAFIKKAEQSSIRLGEWFLSPIHPVQNNFGQWFLETQKFPISSEISSQIVNLPTDVKNIQKVINFLEQNKHDLL